jgi:hypothetical protein
MTGKASTAATTHTVAAPNITLSFSGVHSIIPTASFHLCRCRNLSTPQSNLLPLAHTEWKEVLGV